MMGTNCSYTPILMLVLPEHLQPLSKGLCLFLGQPQSCVLVRPRSSQLAQSGGEETEGGGGGTGRTRRVTNTASVGPAAASAPPRSPSHTTPHCPCLGPWRGILSSLHEQQVFFFFFCILCSPFSAASPPG